MKYSCFNSTHMTKQEKNSNQCQRQCIAKDLVIIQLQTILGTCIFPVISTHKTGKGSQKLLSQRPRGMLAVRSRPLLTPPFLVVGFVASHPPFPTVGLLHFSSSSIQRQPPPNDIIMGGAKDRPVLKLKHMEEKQLHNIFLKNMSGLIEEVKNPTPRLNP